MSHQLSPLLTRHLPGAVAEYRRMKIAVLAPPWLPVPPTGYGGIESVVSLLCERLVHRGHQVTLFAAPGSRSSASVHEVLELCHPDEIGRALYEADHVARVFRAVEDAARSHHGFDVIHDHSGFMALAMADRIATPLVHTLHGPFEPATSRFYRQHADKAHIVAISQAQRASAPPGVPIAEVIPNPIDVAAWPFQPDKDNYLLWLGRMHETKGPHRAIAAAREAGVPLVLAGPVQTGQESFFQAEVAKHVDGDRVRYVGEVGGRHKADLIAHARALLMPITWNEPFGMVMVEALSCGTPVISFAQGAATEIVREGVTGFLVRDEQAMGAAVARLPELDPRNCRADVARRFSVDQVAAAYEGAYRRAGARTALLPSHPGGVTMTGPVRSAARGQLAPTAG